MIKVRIKKLPQARTGYQVQGALVNDVPAMGGADYNAYIGKPKLRDSKYITAVPRDEANLEAEGGETVYGDINGDGMPEHQFIKGPRHHSGGVPLSLPEDTFIFSDTRGMNIKDPQILAMFGKGGINKSFTPAELAKQYDIQKYRKIMEDPDSDAIDRKSAELMMKKFVIKLGCLALAQESMKGFPQGIPAVARPCMEARGITEEQILPSQEITALNDQLKAQSQQEVNSEETMESENQQNPMEEAQSMNQGQPIAQASQPGMEEMMMYGGMRRLRRAQEGMQQPSPEEMAMMEQQGQPQEQEGGGDEMMQIVQGVQEALQQGAEPAEIVMSLVQNGLPPEAVVQIFTQLGASEEEAVGLVQQAMAQGQEQAPAQEEQMAPPMAAYGMSMGGYDMPFYPMPEAEYGMPMGAGMSQNYQGRTERVPSTGPMFGLAKAQNGDAGKSKTEVKPQVRVDVTGMTEEQKQRALYDARTAKENVGKQIVVVNAGKGSIESKRDIQQKDYDEYTTGMDMTSWGTNPQSKLYAAQYRLLEKELQKESVANKLCEETKSSINNKASYVDSKGRQGKTWSEKGWSEPDCPEIIQSFLNHQKTNLTLKANNVDSKLFTNGGNGLESPDRLVKKGAMNPKTGKPITSIAEANEAIKFMQDTYNGGKPVNASVITQKLGVPLQADISARALEQATFHGYSHMIDKVAAGEYDADTKYALSSFVQAPLQSGASDEAGMSGLFKKASTQISPIDGVMGDTTLGQSSAAQIGGYDYKDQVDETSIEKKCPCINEDGSTSYLPLNADKTCPDCPEVSATNYGIPPASYWLQDTIKTTGAFGDLMGLKKYMPWAASANLAKPRPNFMDPTRELAANTEQANIQTQGIGQFAGSQAQSARSSSVQGQAAKNAADTLAKYNNANQGVANQFEMKGTDVANQESMLNQGSSQRLYDQNTVANQQFDNAKLAMRNQLRNYYTNAITNKYKTDALNQMFTNQAVNPSVGGKMGYRPTTKTPSPTNTTGKTKEEWFMWCKSNGDPDPSRCAERMMSSENKALPKLDDDRVSMINTMYGKEERKKGGSTNNKGGYVYSDMWNTFIM
jgi:hypothetical protein